MKARYPHTLRLAIALSAASVFLPLLFHGATASAERARATEFEVKAAYLYNFGKFVRWPEGVAGGSSFTVCVLGNDPFGEALDRVTDGQKIDGSPVTIKRITSAGGIDGCRVLFISKVEPSSLRSAIAVARRQSVLTVSDAPDFLEVGGIIQFVAVGDRVRFAVNLGAAHQAGLQLSAELLKVATKVFAADGSGPQK
jgi:YfiR/HmsC-like